MGEKENGHFRHTSHLIRAILFSFLIAASAPAAVVAIDLANGRVLRETNPNATAELPGSSIKPFVLALAEESGVVTAKTLIVCPSKFSVGRHNLTCSHPRNAAGIDPVAALAYSCNHYFAEIAKRVNVPRALREAGFTNVETPTNDDQRMLQAVGLWGIRVTPRELAAAYVRIYKTKPIITTHGLEAAVEYGTAQGLRGIAVGAKTGTARHGWIGGYTQTVAFAAMAPYGNGSVDAGRLAQDALQKPGGFRISTPTGMRSVALEDYVAGVLAGEAKTFKSTQALHAMAVVARTYAVKFKSRHSKDGFDFCGNTHCQVYNPAGIDPRIRDAVAATAGEFLWFKGTLAATYYSQDCGGRSEAGNTVWPELGSTAPYLAPHDDPYCNRQTWKTSLAVADVNRALAAEHLPTGDTFTLRDRTVLCNSKPISAGSFRFAIDRALGWNQIRSDRFSLSRQGNRLLVEGRGTGHGVGLCQHGADAMGKPYREILAFYYPGTKLGLTAAGIEWRKLQTERLEIWTTEEPPNWLDQAARIELPLPPKIRVQLYPTVALFRDATGEPGWTTASTKGNTIRLAPAGTNPISLRHELLHLAMEQKAKPGLPLWFREGLVLALTGEPVSGAPLPDSQIDAAIFQRTDQVLARRGYATAQRRVQALIANYGRSTILGWVTTGIPAQNSR